VEWSQRRKVDPATFATSVSASDPTKTIPD
jgi:hypothetical protein